MGAIPPTGGGMLRQNDFRETRTLRDAFAPKSPWIVCGEGLPFSIAGIGGCQEKMNDEAQI